ncbi:MAG TPA: glycerophosphodiester phosphodiesterase family protein [Myxococcota bacterium]|nr:glycerophosphodiester phosphodiesterase family protein [Myxococcota bacterium]
MRGPLAAALALLLAAGCSARKDPLLERLRGPQVAAHRGGFGFPDSNTVARFELTRQLGVEVFETDLRLSKDGVVFLFHNERLDKVTDCQGRLADRTADELSHCHLNGLERGPDRFEDALRWAAGRVVLDAELKAREAVRPAIDLVAKYGAWDWVYFQVGSGLRVYQAVRDYDSRVALEASPRGPRAEEWLAALLAARDSRLLSIQLHPDFLSDELVGRVHSAGKVASLNAFQLAPETEGASCTRVFEAGVDIAVTNAPEPCLKQRDGARTTHSASVSARRSSASP